MLTVYYISTNILQEVLHKRKLWELEKPNVLSEGHMNRNQAQTRKEHVLNDVNLWNFMLAEILGNSFVMKNCVNEKSP